MSLTAATVSMQNNLASAIERGRERIGASLTVRQDGFWWIIVIAIAVVIALGLFTAWFIYCRSQGGWPAVDMPAWQKGGTWKMYCHS
ncbi:hypothetical protein [Microbacterium sp. 13-71-7]|uniref:hypothetical protein n=1 Tax=Microbacterium sp. 13-71-7 TaxID=1970399 RepID=UPI0025CCABC2|nr:hypothetical protein [Microbacterium sp. 13-71-7]